MKIELTEQQILQAVEGMGADVRGKLIKHLVLIMNNQELDIFHDWYVRRFVFDPDKDEV